MIEFEFERFDGEIGLKRRKKIWGMAITIVISQAERDLLLKIKRKLKKFIYYLIFNIKREDIYFFICRLNDIRIVRRKETLLTDLEGTILNQNEYEVVERLFGLWEGILWETVHGIILQGTNPEDAKSLGYTYLVLNEKKD